ncbi:Transcriptional regulatory protein WalR [Lacunisphaera limnophila]|uniref:histidine kinase n=1 Tax=Lacunisphaera limnophila TaxID=1838286 RepID=A0A1D8AYE9_9BACT|nr:response regulator [Lacunisphaera limnophila]AOS45905.1 Transcriptional regulatory protein WalR [Lacunisphaera limnophila]
MNQRPTEPWAATPETTTHVDDTVRWVHIVDDDPALGNALAAGLRAHGYHTTFSSTVDIAWSQVHEKLPDLIICDINMPGKNGYRFLEEIRGDPELGSCPFVLMTGNPMYSQPRSAMDRGADDFLLKPFSLETLLACVDARLRRNGISGQNEAALVRELRNTLHRGLSHEFFTPLTGILGFAEMLEQEGDTMSPAEVKDGLRNIMQSARRLHRTLRNYLYALDRLDPDSFAPFPVLSPGTIVQLVQQGALLAAERHGRKADLMLDVAGASIQGGATEIPILVEELVENALGFSRPGTPVKVRGHRIGSEWQLTVEDAGRGMTRQQLKNLGLFRQFEHAKFQQQGLGVGLFIVRQILRRNRGRLQLESNPGAGTKCTVTLPIAHPVRRRSEGGG